MLERVILKSPYGYLRTWQGVRIYNGEQGDAMLGTVAVRVKFDGREQDVIIPRHWLEAVRE